MYLPAKLQVLVNEIFEVGIVVTDAPPLKDDDGHEGKHYHDNSGGEGDGYDERCFHTLCVYDFTLQNFNSPAKRMSHCRENMSQIRENAFLSVLSGK